MYFLRIFYLMLAISFPLFVAGTVHDHDNKRPSGLRFEENRNQWESQVKYKVEFVNGSLFLEKDKFTYAFLNGKDMERFYHSQHAGKQPGIESPLVNAHAFKVNFLSSNPNTYLAASNPFTDYRNYFIGNDPSKWASNVLSYKEVVYNNLYDNIDMKLYGYEDHLKYDFIVRPGGQVRSIRMEYDGTDRLFLKDGNLHIQTSVNEIIEQKPFAYQVVAGKKVKIPCIFNLNKDILTFEFPNGFDNTIPLVIDPVLTFSTYTGSVADNWGYTSTYDANGNLYAGGIVFGLGYPFTTGAYQTASGGGIDIGISKFNSNGTGLIYSTYLGGTSSELPHSLVVNNNNELLVYGTTGSINFPITVGAYDMVFNGGTAVNITGVPPFPNGSDIFISKFNAVGSALSGSTFIGGSGNDGLNLAATLQYNYGDHARGEIITDTAGNVYVASCTQSVNFPTTLGAFQTASSGNQDGVVLKFNSSLTFLAWSNYLGGSGNDAAYSLKLDNIGNVFTCGGTTSNNFPGTTGGLNPAYKGGVLDGYVARISSNGTSLLNASYIGTNQYDQCYFIEINANNEIYLVGQTRGNYPVTPGTYVNSGGSQFIHKLNNTLTGTVFSTRFGSGTAAVNISPTAFLVDVCNNIYVAGWGGAVNNNFNLATGNTLNMPLTLDANQSTTDGSDLYFIIFTPTASSLVYASYFGGNGVAEHQDGGTSRFDGNGTVYQAVCAGCGGNSLFPTTPGAWSTTNGSSNCNLGALKLDFQVIINADASAAPSNTGCVPYTVNFINNSLSSFSYKWDFNDGSAIDTISNPSHVFSTPGTFNVMLVAYGSGCVAPDTFYLPITVLPEPLVNLGSDSILCPGDSITLDAGSPGSTYLWSTGETLQTITVDSSAIYWVTVNNGCAETDSIDITVLNLLTLGNDTNLCNGQTLTINATNPGNNYLWSTGETSRSIIVSTTGVYWVTETIGSCTQTDTINVTFNSAPVVSLGNDTVLCNGAFITLDADNPGNTYLWSTGETGQTISANTSGIYWVTVNNGCTKTDSIEVAVLKLLSLGNDTTLCDKQKLTLNATNPGNNYLWSTGETTRSVIISTAGVYWVKETTGTCSQTDTIHVAPVPSPLVSLGPDAILCQGASIALNAGNPGSSYLWSTGINTQTITISSSGDYWAMATLGNCHHIDTISIIPGPSVLFSEDIFVCDEQEVLLNARNPNARYLWSTGETTSTIIVKDAGKYWVEIIFDNCTSTDTINVSGIIGASTLFFPNTFTPDNDGLNDNFTGLGQGIISFEMKIFNRWGELVFETSDIDKGWDGTYKGEIVKMDVYIWIVDFRTICKENKTFRKVGHVLVKR